MPGRKAYSWGDVFNKLKCYQGGADTAVISCHGNAKDGPYIDRKGIRKRLGDPAKWPQKWVDALKNYDLLIIDCCYVGNTDYGQQVANRIGIPVQMPGRGSLPEVWWPVIDPHWWFRGPKYYPGNLSTRPKWPYKEKYLY